MGDYIDRIGAGIARANKKETSLEEIRAQVGNLGRLFANRLPEDVEFVIVLSKKGDREANGFTSSLPDDEVRAKLKVVAEQLRSGIMRGSWGNRSDGPEQDRRIIEDFS